jgi:hypothetical protein
VLPGYVANHALLLSRESRSRFCFSRKAEVSRDTRSASHGSGPRTNTSNEQTITPPRSPYYKDMSAVMAQQFNANVRGAQTPAQTAENVQNGLEDIIQKAGGS